MATRAQVVVRGVGREYWLYHHYDGWPKYMVPRIAKAYEHGWELVLQMVKEMGLPPEAANEPWAYGQIVRPHTVVALLCWSEPLGYEVEERHELHADVEFVYLIEVSPRSKEWQVSIYVPSDVFYGLPAAWHNLNLAAGPCSPTELLRIVQEKSGAVKEATC